MSLLQEKRTNIAIIGGGISGLGSAYLLYPHHNVTIYEKNDYIGGHSRTVDVPTAAGKIPVDTGFIVFNKRNYPLLTSLFNHLEVEIQKSNMSFGVSINNGWLEYSTNNLNTLFTQRSNLFNPCFLRMLRDIWLFNKQARHYLTTNQSLTLGQFLEKLNLHNWFKKYYLLPMGSAIWSTSITKMLEFPALTFVQFFANHGLLTITDQPQWYTVKNGSREYIKRLTAPFCDKIITKTCVSKVIRNNNGVTIYDSMQNAKNYDLVIFACHADQALQIIDQPSPSERNILEKFTYNSNRIVLHSDLSFMPQRKKAWASWVYLSNTANCQEKHVSLSYWMNNLQSLPTSTQIISTLNPESDPNPELTYDQCYFDHPVFNEAAIQAQQQLQQIQGKDFFWFSGAYQRYGFHEDGLMSSVNIAEQMGIKIPWI